MSKIKALSDVDTSRLGFDNVIYQITNLKAFDLLFMQIRGQTLLYFLRF